MKTQCLSCRYYKIHDAQNGTCRVDNLLKGTRNAEKPTVRADENCERWKDCGQTYYIRLGWIRNLEKENITP